MLKIPYFSPDIFGIILSSPMIDITDEPPSLLKGVLSFSSMFYNYGVSTSSADKNSSLKSQQKYMYQHKEHYSGSLCINTLMQMLDMSDHLREEIKEKILIFQC